jgi:hypothetical protein
MQTITPNSAKDVVEGCGEQLVACNQMLSDLDARLTEIAETISWESFTEPQRAALSRMHGNVRNAKERLLPLYV